MCLPGRVWLYGFFVPDVQSVVRALSNTTGGPLAQPQLQLGVKADSEREQHQPRKVLCSVGVACLSSERVQEATEGMVVVR